MMMVEQTLPVICDLIATDHTGDTDLVPCRLKCLVYTAQVASKEYHHRMPPRIRQLIKTILTIASIVLFFAVVTFRFLLQWTNDILYEYLTTLMIGMLLLMGTAGTGLSLFYPLPAKTRLDRQAYLFTIFLIFLATGFWILIRGITGLIGL